MSSRTEEFSSQGVAAHDAARIPLRSMLAFAGDIFTRQSRVTIMGRATILRFPLSSVTGSESRRNRFIFVEVVMLYVAIGVLMFSCLRAPACTSRYDQSRAVISASEWVRLMRKNDMRNDRATKTRPSGRKERTTRGGSQDPATSGDK